MDILIEGTYKDSSRGDGIEESVCVVKVPEEGRGQMKAKTGEWTS